MSNLANVLHRLGITITTKYAPLPKHLADNLSRGGSAWSVTLRHGRKTLTTPFFQGSAHHAAPTAADVMYCLLSDASSAGMSFSEFCNEFGYSHDDCVDEDTGRPLRTCKCKSTWNQIEKMAPKVRAFLGSDLEKVEEAAQDY